MTADDQKERERQLLRAEMIPTKQTVLTFWQKFVELQSKMLWHMEPVQSHMYGSEPLDWPLMSKGIAYWVDKDSNVCDLHSRYLRIILNYMHVLFSGTNLPDRQHCHMVLGNGCARCLCRHVRLVSVATPAPVSRPQRR